MNGSPDDVRECFGRLGFGQFIASQFNGLASITFGVGKCQGGEDANVFHSDALHTLLRTQPHACERAAENVRAGPVVIVHEEDGAQNGICNVERVNVLFDDPLAFEMFLPHAAMRGANRRIEQMLHPCGFGCVGNGFALLDLTFKTYVGQPEVLHAKDAINSLERGIEFGAVIQVACDKFCAERFEFLRGGLVHITRQCADYPAFC